MAVKAKSQKVSLTVESSSDSPAHDNSDSSQSESSPHRSEEKDLQPAITLSCLRSWDAEKMDQCFKNYVSKKRLKNTDRQSKIGVSKLFKVEDFTPWWDGFSKPVNSKSSAKARVSPWKDPDSFDNWFAKTGGESSTSSSSWLCGPGLSQATDDASQRHQAPVEDIEVPSIYNQTPKTKGRRALKRDRKAEREKTLGKKWFEMRAPEVDDKTRNDMEMIRMRGILDPKRFYKNNDRGGLPKYFQMGTVVDEGTDFYSSRLTKKQRKQTLVEELMADANVRQYNKRKYSEVQQKMRNKKFKGKKSSAS